MVLIFMFREAPRFQNLFLPQTPLFLLGHIRYDPNIKRKHSVPFAEPLSIPSSMRSSSVGRSLIYAQHLLSMIPFPPPPSEYFLSGNPGSHILMLCNFPRVFPHLSPPPSCSVQHMRSPFPPLLCLRPPPHRSFETRAKPVEAPELLQYPPPKISSFPPFGPEIFPSPR